MDKDTRNSIERATQRARRLLEDDFASQLEGTFDVLRTAIAPEPGSHLSPQQRLQRHKILAAIQHKQAAGMRVPEAVLDYVRDSAFTTLNRFIALKLLESRELVLECISKGEQSAGYREFCGLAPGVTLLPESAGYRLFIESVFDELSTEVKVLFDRRDQASLLWPKRVTFEALLDALNAPELSSVWNEDETIGWVYQFFNSGDERKRMREESQAPRNSRELAVRNQFFTPRYVVEFLVDNTLGRTWLSMHGEHSTLKEQCRYFVRTEDEPMDTRAWKDVRDMRVLDPACGSGHFLLYCFDLLLAIYEEAWAVEATNTGRHASRRTLQENYKTVDDIRRAAPALILEHNLYGIDIDPRAVQIAALALWLRAQRAWRDLGLPRSERPTVRRTHIVVAEAIPGDAALIEEFAGRLNPPLLRDLFRKMVGEMRLAGELGALIPVEAGISVELRRAREQFVKQQESSGFLPGMEPERQQGELDLSGIDDDRFFEEAEVRIVNALRQFAEAAANGSRVRRVLFADDAAQGIALIELLRMRYDVVLMNPPFGAASLAAKKEFEKAYPRTKNDIFAAFVERGIDLLHPHGLLGAITSRTGFFLSSFQSWREEILLEEAPPVVFADLGHGVMDAAMVEAAAYCVEKDATNEQTRAVFLRLLDAKDKSTALMELARQSTSGGLRYEVNPRSFASIARSPFAYWVPPSLRFAFERFSGLKNATRFAARGPYTLDDFRFVRLFHEVEAGRIKSTREDTVESLAWVRFFKGGAFSRYYFDAHLVLDWSFEGKALKALVSAYRDARGWGPNWTAAINGYEFYFRPGTTWTHRTTSLFSMRAMPAGCIFSAKGPALIVDDEDERLALLGLCNSKVFQALFDVSLGAADAAARSYDVGIMQRLPIPQLDAEATMTLGKLARAGWLARREIESKSSAAPSFCLPALLDVAGESLSVRTATHCDRLQAIGRELDLIQFEIDEKCLALYGISEADRHILNAGFSAYQSANSVVDVEQPEDETSEDAEGDAATDVATNLVVELMSWAVGAAFGRFDIRLAIHSRPHALPLDAEPFNPLPLCSPGILTDADGRPAAAPPVGYPIAFPTNGILVGDPGHAHDLPNAVRKVFDAVFDNGAEQWWHDVAVVLDPVGHDIGAWLASSYFGDHIRRFSKSRRKAPIIWQLGTPSGRYSLWLYAHHITADTFFQLQNEVVGPKVSHEEQQLAILIQNAGGSPSASERREIGLQEALVEELRTMLDEVKRIAPLWRPNLDDGVVLTMAPLWRLVPQHKSWQRELKATCEELAAGKFDWAHLAMHLWPERVFPKCATDRSLAIAHGVEDIFWLQETDDKWAARTRPTRSIDELVRERTSPAVKAALRSLLEAPLATGNGPRGARRRAGAIADGGSS